MTQKEVNRALSPFSDSQDGESYEDYTKWLAAKRKQEEGNILNPPTLVVTSPGGTQNIPVSEIAESPTSIPQGKYLCVAEEFNFRNYKSRVRKKSIAEAGKRDGHKHNTYAQKGQTNRGDLPTK